MQPYFHVIRCLITTKKFGPIFFCFQFFGANIFGEDQFFQPPIFFYPIFFGPNFFGQHFFSTVFFYRKFFSSQIFFRPKFFCFSQFFPPRSKFVQGQSDWALLRHQMFKRPQKNQKKTTSRLTLDEKGY